MARVEDHAVPGRLVSDDVGLGVEVGLEIAMKVEVLRDDRQHDRHGGAAQSIVELLARQFHHEQRVLGGTFDVIQRRLAYVAHQPHIGEATGQHSGC